MARRDYVGVNKTKKQKQAKKRNKWILIIISLALVVAFASGLYILKSKSPNHNHSIAITTEKKHPKSQLPSPPEEVWSYIKALETRTVSVDDSPQSLEKNMRLTDEQKKVLSLMEQDRKANEKARLKQAEENKTINTEKSEIKQKTTALDNKKIALKTEDNKTSKETVKKTETTSANPAEKKFGLQCGAFKNRQQAEKIQSRILLLGFDARINKNADWNRVVVGPLGDRNTVNQAQERIKSIATCVIIRM